MVFIGVIITFGAIIDENVQGHVITKTCCAKARSALILKWLMVGFLLSSSYKSVLLATLVSPAYEKPIDTVQDLLDTERSIGVGHAGFLRMMSYSGLESLRELVTKIQDMANVTEISRR